VRWGGSGVGGMSQCSVELGLGLGLGFGVS